MSKVDRNEAPEGYVALRCSGKKEYDCMCCAFWTGHKTCSLKDWHSLCTASYRKDGQSVIFVKKQNKE